MHHHQPLVSFMGIGVQKAGTTSIFAYLNQHPQIRMGQKKELHYFDDEDHFAQKPDYSLYEQQFVRDPERANLLYVEVTPIYLYWSPALRRIWEYNPNMKCIVLLRNPITRAYSHWNMEYGRQWDALSFEEAILQ